MRKTNTRLVQLAICLAAALSLPLFAGRPTQVAAAAGPGETSGYRVLKPIQSGDLTLFPVVPANARADAKTPANPFLTLDEGLKSGEVEVTEYGKVRGLIRLRGGPVNSRYQGDQVNTLVLLNNSKRPLLLLAGEIVTGGKQDRIIAKDRIVPAGADPIDLSVFCVEHGRWTESSEKFGATAASEGKSFMVQPAVRQQAMVAKDQQQVWNAVGGAISNMAVAAAPPKPAAIHGTASGNETVTVTASSGVVMADTIAVPSPVAVAPLPTTSYAKAMQMQAVTAAVDQESAGLLQSREAALATLRAEHAIGVVVAIRGEIIWADLFSDPDLLGRYWVKLVRSYAAEGLGAAPSHKAPASIAEAQAFLDAPSHGREESDGEVGVYRVREIKTSGTDLFALESLLPGTNYDVHISKLKLKGLQPTPISHPPIY